jgi:8-amino-7-oxononanoate synthase
LVYTTALPESSVHHLLTSYSIFPQLNEERKELQNLIQFFQSLSFKYETLKSSTAVQGVIIPGNQETRSVATKLQQKNFDVRPILYPTVPKGKERLRIVLHSFNTFEQILELAKYLS